MQHGIERWPVEAQLLRRSWVQRLQGCTACCNHLGYQLMVSRGGAKGVKIPYVVPRNNLQVLTPRRRFVPEHYKPLRLEAKTRRQNRKERRGIQASV